MGLALAAAALPLKGKVWFLSLLWLFRCFRSTKEVATKSSERQNESRI